MPLIGQLLQDQDQFLDNRSYYVGIDPGQSGGLAVVDKNASIMHTIPMPDTEQDIWNWFNKLPHRNCIAIVERVHSFPGKGPRCRLCGKPKRQQGVASTFKFGMGYGRLRMALHAASIKFEETLPQVWQKALGISARKKTGTRTEWKNRLKAKAQQLFPRVNITLKTADAVLIAEYCRRKCLGIL